MPVPAGTPGTGRQINSMLAGINIAVFKNTHNLDGARKFVKFMTSDERTAAAQQDLRLASRPSRPPSRTRRSTARTPKVLRETLARSAAPLPQIAEESQFETSVGTAIKDLFADAAGSRPPGDDRLAVKARSWAWP